MKKLIIILFFIPVIILGQRVVPYPYSATWQGFIGSQKVVTDSVTFDDTKQYDVYYSAYGGYGYHRLTSILRVDGIWVANPWDISQIDTLNPPALMLGINQIDTVPGGGLLFNTGIELSDTASFITIGGLTISKDGIVSTCRGCDAIDIGGNAIIDGDLEVGGDLTFGNSASLETDDFDIYGLWKFSELYDSTDVDFYSGATDNAKIGAALTAMDIVRFSRTYDSDDKSLVIPAGKTLDFSKGGDMTDYHLNVTGNHTKIINPDNHQIFCDSVTLLGTWDIEYAMPEWFGAACDGTTDDYAEIQASINSFETIKLQDNGSYDISSPIILEQYNKLFGKNTTITITTDTAAIITKTKPFHIEGIDIHANYTVASSTKYGLYPLIIDVQTDGVSPYYSNAKPSVIRDIKIIHDNANYYGNGIMVRHGATATYNFDYFNVVENVYLERCDTAIYIPSLAVSYGKSNGWNWNNISIYLTKNGINVPIRSEGHNFTNLQMQPVASATKRLIEVEGNSNSFNGMFWDLSIAGTIWGDGTNGNDSLFYIKSNASNTFIGLGAEQYNTYVQDNGFRTEYYTIDLKRNVKNWGASGNGVADDFDEIQNCFDVGSGYVVIGESASDVFSISQPIYISGVDGITVEINGTVKLQDGDTALLKANTASTNTYVLITKANNSKFTVGQWVSIVDDTCRTQGGGTGQTRKEAVAFPIIAKVAGTTYDTLKFSDKIGTHRTNASALDALNYTTAQNAKVGHTQNCFIFEDCSNITILGNGIIDNNKSGQMDCEPIRFVNGVLAGEDVRAGCGLSLCFPPITPETLPREKNVIIKDITVQNSLLHNIAVTGTDTITVSNVKSYRAHDKSIILYYASNILVENSTFIDSDYEDGIQPYFDVDDLTVNNCYFENIGRTAIGALDGLRVDNCKFINCATTFAPASGMTYSNIYIKGGGKVNHTSDNYAPLKLYGSALLPIGDATFNNLVIDSVLVAPAAIYIRDSVYNLTFNGGSINYLNASASNGYAVYFYDGAAVGSPRDITFNDFSFNDNKRAVATIGALSENISFLNCEFKDNNANFIGISGSTKYQEFNYFGCTGLTESSTMDYSGKIKVPTLNTNLSLGGKYIANRTGYDEGLSIANGGAGTFTSTLRVNDKLYLEGTATYLDDVSGSLGISTTTANGDQYNSVNDGGVTKYPVLIDGATGNVKINATATTDTPNATLDINGLLGLQKQNVKPTNPELDAIVFYSDSCGNVLKWDINEWDTLMVGRCITDLFISDDYESIYYSMTNKPTAAIALAQDTMVYRLDTLGVWGRFGAFFYFSQYSNTASEALLNWKNLATPATMPDKQLAFTSNVGFTLNDENVVDGRMYINSNYNPTGDSNWDQDSATMIIAFDMDDAATTGRSICGAWDATVYTRMITYQDATNGRILFNSAGADYGTCAFASKDLYFWGVTRIAAGAAKGWRNTTSYGFSKNSNGEPNLSLYIGAANPNGGGASPVLGVYRFFAAGSYLTDAEYASAIGIINHCMDVIGTGVY